MMGVILKLLVILLAFGSIGSLAYAYIPTLLNRYAKAQKTKFEKVSTKLDDMFLFTERKRLLRIYTVTPLSLGLAGFLFMQNLMGLIAGFALGLLVPSIIIRNMSMRRRNKFRGQLVDGLLVLSGSLKAGLSLNQALEVLVEEMPPPISDEFALVMRENKMSVPLEDCLAHLKQRMPVDDLELISIAIGIVRETGGDLTEVFDSLVFTIREKQKLANRVKALTVQGRLQGYIMMVLPIAFSIFIYFVNPGNFQIMLKDQLGRMLLVWAVVSQVIGIFLIKTLSKVEV